MLFNLLDDGDAELTAEPQLPFDGQCLNACLGQAKRPKRFTHLEQVALMARWKNSLQRGSLSCTKVTAKEHIVPGLARLRQHLRLCNNVQGAQIGRHRERAFFPPK